ncbi:hypothetical protein [Streptomyces sp. NPDC058326]|uniref:hypothetical protein n=1 Tax=Streptomyces sp. NPDC058326 TaxID=3346447 RepID=UPI0036EE1C19
MHEILSRVQASGARTFRDGWVEVLGADWGTDEFARRHAEVAALLSETIQQIFALPEAQRVRFSRYAPQWWTAVVQPDAGWSDTGRPARVLVAQETLDHLASAADVLEAVMRGTGSAPAGENLQSIAESCHSWLEILDQTSDAELPSALKSQIVAQITHLLWLIDHAELFGVARVSNETNQVLGSLTQATSLLTGVDAQVGGRWKRAFFGLLTASIVFTAGATQLQTAIEAGSSLAKEIVQVVDDVAVTAE